MVKKKTKRLFDPLFVVAAILDWAQIANNKRGYIELKNSFDKTSF